MNKHLDLALCIRLKAGGFPQDLPGWDGDYHELPTIPLNPDGMLCVTSDGRLFWQVESEPSEQVLCPPIISPDGAVGVLPWLNSKGVIYWIEWLGIGRPTFMAEHGGQDFEALTPEALIAAVLDALGAP